jgi:hypothetical protein
MSFPSRKKSASFFKSLIIFVLASLIFAAPPAQAEPLLQLYKETDILKLETVRLAVKRHSVLSDTGDLVIRSGGISMTVAYNAPIDTFELRKSSRTVEREDCPSINGISLKVAFMF